MLAALDEPARRAVAAAASVVQLEAGQVIALEGDEAPPVFFVLDGLVVGYRLALDGRAQTLTRLHVGDPFYMPCALGDCKRAPVSTRAACDSLLLQLSQEAFRALVDEHPQLARAALTELANKVSRFVRLAGDLGILSVRARLARLLLELADGCEPPVVRGTQEDLAAAIATVREVVSRHLHELADAGVIRIKRGRVELLDVAALRQEAGR